MDQNRTFILDQLLTENILRKIVGSFAKYSWNRFRNVDVMGVFVAQLNKRLRFFVWKNSKRRFALFLVKLLNLLLRGLTKKPYQKIKSTYYKYNIFNLNYRDPYVPTAYSTSLVSEWYRYHFKVTRCHRGPKNIFITEN